MPTPVWSRGEAGAGSSPRTATTSQHPHRPACVGEHGQQTDPRRPRPVSGPALLPPLHRLGDQPEQHLPRDRQPLDLSPVPLDQLRDLRGLLLQPEPLGPTRRFPLAQQPQDLVTVPPVHPTESRSTNPYQPAAECHNRAGGIDVHPTRHSEGNAPPLKCLQTAARRPLNARAALQHNEDLELVAELRSAAQPAMSVGQRRRQSTRIIDTLADRALADRARDRRARRSLGGACVPAAPMGSIRPRQYRIQQ